MNLAAECSLPVSVSVLRRVAISSSGQVALLRMPRATVRSLGMVRRNRPDPLQPLPVSTWLVVRDKHRSALESREIARGADLRAILQAARSERIAAGWTCTSIGSSDGCFFAERPGERVQVGIETNDPAGPGAPWHCDPPPR